MERDPLQRVADIQPDVEAQEILRATLVRFIMLGTEGTSLEAIAAGAGCEPEAVEVRFGSLAGCYDKLYDASWHELTEALENNELNRGLSVLETAEDTLIADAEFIMDSWLEKDRPLSWAISYITSILDNPRPLSDPHYVSEAQGVYENRLFTLCEKILAQNPLTSVVEPDPVRLGGYYLEFIKTTLAFWGIAGPQSLPKDEALDTIRTFLQGKELEE